jgi:Tfp pilus assembly protein PilF
MSLIMNALKKAQQLRLKGSEGAPILKYPHPDKKRGRGSKKQWILIGAGLISLCIVLFILLKPVSPPLATQLNRAIVPIEEKPSVPVTEKISPEPPKEMVSLSKDHSSRFQGEKASLETKPSPIEKKGESLIKQAPPPLPPATQKEEASSKSIGLEQEGGKDRTLTSDVLNHFNSGVTFYNQKEFSKAVQAYQKVIELDPTYVEAYNNLGIIYQMMGDVDRAFGVFQKSTEINPRYEKGYNNLGILLFLKGRYEEAVEVFQKALAINSNNIESHINLGILFKKKGEWEKAIESYQKALAINPLHREAHYNMALLYEQLENLELAINHYQQFIQLSSKSHPELAVKVQRHLNALVEAKRNIGK